jgi:hypothetical protein
MSIAAVLSAFLRREREAALKLPAQSSNRPHFTQLIDANKDDYPQTIISSSFSYLKRVAK